MDRGSLILFPHLLSEEATFREPFKLFLLEEVQKLDGLIAESQKGARSFFKIFKDPKVNSLTLSFLTERSSKAELDFFLEPIEKGQKWGLISDAGLPGIGDPGSALVLKARSKRLDVKAFGVTCSITGALMLSGLNGQHFVFHGYVPKEEEGRKKALLEMEKRSKKEGSTQIFIEAPHRNEALFETLIQTLDPDTMLCIAVDLSAATEEVDTMKVRTWARKKLNLDKRPAIFLFNSM